MNEIRKDLLDEEGVKECYNLIKKHGSISTVSRMTNISPNLLRRVEIIEGKKYNCTKEGLGPENLKQYLIATREADDPNGWNNADPKIQRARELYDSGEVELATGRDGMKLNLYAIPRKVRHITRNYFTLAGE